MEEIHNKEELSDSGPNDEKPSQTTLSVLKTEVHDFKIKVEVPENELTCEMKVEFTEHEQDYEMKAEDPEDEQHDDIKAEVSEDVQYDNNYFIEKPREHTMSEEDWKEGGPSSSSDDEEAILLLLCKDTPRPKRLRVRDNNERRKERSEYHNLCRELESHEDRFYWYFHMSKCSFEELHDLVKPLILKKDTNYRKSIGTRERLAVFLRYLRTGESFLKISISFRIGRSTVSMIVEQVSKAIWKNLQPIYMPKPTDETWKQSELGYRDIWNFPNCVGSLDGKHVKIVCPSNGGSDYSSYKSHLSIVLFAIANPFYKFTMIDIGSYGQHSDSNVFEHSEIYRHYLLGKSLLPPKPLPGMTEPVPHVLIGDEGFALKTFLMRPYPKALTIRDERKRRYNYRLCHARCSVENTFNILTEKWRVFQRPMEFHVEKAIHVIKAACCLHNYVRIKHGDTLDTTGAIQAISSETNMRQNSKNGALIPLRRTNARSSNDAMIIREKFVTYCNS